jgi:two-component system chemotaxis family response regulator WspR
VLLPRTHLSGAVVVAETIRDYFSQATLEAKASSRRLGTVTVSIGAACHRLAEPPDQFVHRADQTLYLAKRAGKNRTATEDQEEALAGKFEASPEKPQP